MIEDPWKRVLISNDKRERDFSELVPNVLPKELWSMIFEMAIHNPITYVGTQTKTVRNVLTWVREQHYDRFTTYHIVCDIPWSGSMKDLMTEIRTTFGKLCHDVEFWGVKIRRKKAHIYIHGAGYTIKDSW